jgi:ankyrin repeat protein
MRSTTFWWATAAFLVLLSVVGLVASEHLLGPKFEHPLLDRNKQPVANAWVVARRVECNGGFGHCHTSCFEVRVAKTDEQGRYFLGRGLRPLAQYGLTAYRDGYSPGYEGEVLSMLPEGSDRHAPQMDPVNERIAELADSAWGMACVQAPREQTAKLVPVYQAMLREAASIARYPEHRQVAREICRQMSQALSPQPSPEGQELYLRDIAPVCGAPIDDTKEQEILNRLSRRDVEFVRQAARDGFDFNRILDGRTPLIVTAAMEGAADMVTELLVAGAKPDAVGTDRRTALDHVLQDFHPPESQRLPVVRALLVGGADPNRPDIWGYPPVVRVAPQSRAEIFELLLDHGANINQGISCKTCYERGKTVLFEARTPGFLRLAIERGANVNANIGGATPLWYVQSVEAATILLEHGADPNLASTNGGTPLMRAIHAYETAYTPKEKQSYREIVEALVTAGARLDVKDSEGHDPLSNTKDEAFKQRLRVIAANVHAR